MLNTAEIHFDGGTVPNPGAKYGSFSILFDSCFQLEVKRKSFGHGTNNEAEFDALIAALNLLHESCSKAFVFKSNVAVMLNTDSTIVRNWIQRFDADKLAKVTNERRLVMGGLASRAMELLKPFHSHEINWNSREVNVEKFGH